MKHIGWLIIVCGIFAGCVDVDVRTKLNPSGGGIETWKFVGTALMAGQLRKHVAQQFHFDNLSEEFHEGDFILTASKKFAKPQERNDRLRNITWEKSGLWKQTCIYTETWSLRNWDSRVPVKVRVAVDVPGTITASNADQSQRGEAVWMFSADDIRTSKVLHVEFFRWNFLLIIPATFLILGIVFLISMVFADSRPARCSSCGKKVPFGSAFCNACGSKMSQD